MVLTTGSLAELDTANGIRSVGAFTRQCGDAYWVRTATCSWMTARPGSAGPVQAEQIMDPTVQRRIQR